MQAARVEFRKGSEKSYDFAIPPYLQVSSGDIAVVLCDPRGKGIDEYDVGYVIDVYDTCTYALKPVLDVVDIARYEKYKARLDKVDSIRAALDTRFKEANRIQLYEKLAETDPKTKALLQELRDLQQPE